MVPWGLSGMFICLVLDLTEGDNTRQAFRVQPQNTSTLEGETAVLKCEVDNPSGIVQWVKDGLLLGPNRDIPRFPHYSMVGEPRKGEYHLQVRESRLEDDAWYECQVGPSENSSGIVSQSILLTVHIPPKRLLITQYRINSTVTWVAGMEYPLTCQVKDARPPAMIAFIKGGTEVPDVTSTIQPGSQDKVFSTEASLRVTPQKSDNGKWLLCSASNAVSLIPAVAGFIMNVLYPPDPPIIQGYKGSLVKAKDNLKLTCISLNGNPLATLQWLKNGDVISRNWETDDTSQLSRSDLSLSLTAEDNRATVSCQALNQVSPLPLEASVTLHVVFLPEEVKIIGSSSTQENKPLSLSCSTSSSNPPVLLRWWLGWKELNATDVTVSEADHGGKITVSNVTYMAHREDNGLPLICEAYSEAIMYAKTATVTVKVQYPPQKIWIDVPPPEKRFRTGTEVKLTCFASGGNPLPRLDWYKETKIVRDGTSSGSSGNIVSKELILTTVPSDNMAVYRCNASGVPRTAALTAYTRLHVQFPPLHVTITVTAKEVRRGQSLTLTCKSGSSNPPSSLVWFKEGKKLNGTDLGQKKAEYGGFSTSGKVSLLVSSADHGKWIECHAHSSVLNEDVNTFYQLTVLLPFVGSLTKGGVQISVTFWNEFHPGEHSAHHLSQENANVTAVSNASIFGTVRNSYVPPEFSATQPHIVQAVEKEAVRLPLLVSASPPEITYHWSFLGEVILTEGSPRYHLRNGGSLEIWNVTRADAGKYTICCKNQEGHNETTVVLDVQYSPTIRSIGDPTYVDVGGTAEVVCQADANPAPVGMFQWRWLADLERDLQELGIELLAEGLVGRLRIQNARRSHAGLYECQVDNGISPAARSSARLVVRYPPEIMKGPGQRKVAAPGDGMSQAALYCHAQGAPNVHFSWAKNGVSLDPHCPRYTMLTEHEGSLHTSILTIANVSAVLDYATFTCTANNELGTDTLDIQLLSTSHPDPPTGLKVVSVAHNWLALEWTPGFDGGLPQSFRVRYHWPGAPSFLYVDVFPPQSPVFTLTGLQPNTLYNVSVHARNALGESSFADDGAGLAVTTAGREEEPVDGEPTMPVTPVPESPALPLPFVVLLSALGGLLLVSNFTFLGCLLRRRQAQGFKEDGTQAGARAKVRSSNNYAVSKWLKFGGRAAQLAEHSSEESTSVKGSSAKTSTGSAATPQPWFQLGRQAESETDAGVTDPNISAPWLSSSELHEYEEVLMPRKYEEMGPLYAAWHPEEQVWIPGYADSYPQSGRSLADYEEIMQSYDAAMDLVALDRDLPFEERGELV